MRSLTGRTPSPMPTWPPSCSPAQQLAGYRVHAEELRLLEDRDRIARDPHDHVIQELFATGLSLHSVAATDQQHRLMTVVRKIDQVVREIRGNHLRPAQPTRTG